MGQVMKLREFATPTDAAISGAVRALTMGRGLLPEYVARQVGMTRGSIYNRLRGTAPWKASEVLAMSRFFEVRIDDLYSGFDGRFGPQDPTSPSAAGRARQDSNLQPLDP